MILLMRLTCFFSLSLSLSLSLFSLSFLSSLSHQPHDPHGVSISDRTCTATGHEQGPEALFTRQTGLWMDRREGEKVERTKRAGEGRNQDAGIQRWGREEGREGGMHCSITRSRMNRCNKPCTLPDPDASGGVP